MPKHNLDRKKEEKEETNLNLLIPTEGNLPTSLFSADGGSYCSANSCSLPTTVTSYNHPWSSDQTRN